MAAPVGDRIEERRRGREEVVQDPTRGVVDGLDVRHAAVTIDRESLHMTGCAADLLEREQPLTGVSVCVVAGLKSDR